MPLRWKLSFSPFSFLGEGLGMRACESNDAMFFLGFGERRVAFKDKTINRVDVAKPSPLALHSQRERGNSRCIVVDAVTPSSLQCRPAASRTHAVDAFVRLPQPRAACTFVPYSSDA